MEEGEDWDRCSGVGGWGLCWLDARFEGLVSMACLLVFFCRNFSAVERALMVSTLDGSRVWVAQSTPFPCNAFSTYGDEMVCHPCRLGYGARSSCGCGRCISWFPGSLFIELGLILQLWFGDQYDRIDVMLLQWACLPTAQRTASL